MRGRLCGFRRNTVILVLVAVFLSLYLIKTRLTSAPTTACQSDFRDLCDAFARGDVAGELCSYICLKARTSIEKCFNFDTDGKKVKVLWNGVHRFILKSAFKTVSPVLDDSDLALLRLTPLEVLNDAIQLKISDHASFPTDVVDKSKLISQVTKPLDGLIQQTAIFNATLQGLLGLVKQPEYLVLVVLQPTNLVPKLYGTCGHFYGLESAPPDPSVDTNTFFAGFPRKPIGTWKNRAQLALKFLHLAQMMDLHYSEPIVLCDIKGDNFGMTSDGLLKLIDVDTLFFESNLQSQLKGQACEIDRDCDFWDCHGECNAGTCSGQHKNGNIQAMCLKILRHHEGNGYHGLLEDSPQTISGHLDELLTQCIGSTTQSSSQTIARQLQTVLLDSLLD